MTHGSLFSGIGGFDLAAEMMGWENLFHCEWNPFGQRVLHHYWPNAEQFTDITKSDFTKYANRIDVLTGGFPCQPYSLAGKRKGKDDERHLWPEMLRAIREIQPRWVVGENVFGLVNWNGWLVFHEVQADLEAEGYEVFPYVLPAAGINAPHRRDRIFFVAYRASKGLERGTGQSIQGRSIRFTKCSNENAPNPNSNGQHRCDSEHEINASEGRQYAQRNTFPSLFDGYITDADGNGGRENNGQRESKLANENGSRSYWQDFPTQSPICGRNDGLPTELDGITFSKWRNESIKAYGNAIVPQVALQIFKAIEQYELL